MTSRCSKAFAPGALCVLAWPVLAAAAPTIAAPGDDIRDIRPLISIPPWWHFLAAGVAAALILALIFAAIRYWRRRKGLALTPEQRALRALDEAEVLARAGECRDWADLVANTLRTALARQLERESCPETTDEIATVDWSKRSRGNTVDAPVLVAILSTCDLTRFALARLDPNALLAETQRARAWITRLFAVVETPTQAAQPPSVEVSP